MAHVSDEFSPGRPATGARSAGPVTAAELTIVPANQASWADLMAIFDGEPDKCSCQRFKTTGWFWDQATNEGRRQAFRDQVNCDDPAATSTTGLVAYLNDGGHRVPVGWVAVEPRTEYARILQLRRTWTGREAEKAHRADDSVWSVTCFVVRKGYRGRGVTYALAAATIPYAEANGARALEGYPMITQPGKEIIWGELHVGARQAFAEAGFTEVAHPTPRRVVMRVDFRSDRDGQGATN
jgi:GNAT superfamily N-acetyltransferase